MKFVFSVLFLERFIDNFYFQPFVIDESIDIKEEGFLQNAEDSYNYINEVKYDL